MTAPETVANNRGPVTSEVSLSFEPVMQHVAGELGIGVQTLVEPGGPVTDRRGRPSHLPEDRIILGLTHPKSTEPAGIAFEPFWLRTHKILGVFRTVNTETIAEQGLGEVHTLWEQARAQEAAVKGTADTRPLVGAGARRRR